MSTQDLITSWEEALAHAFGPPECGELPEGDLEMAEGVAVRSSLRAGGAHSMFDICHTPEYSTCGCAIP